MAEKDTESLFDELIGEATSSEVEELISNPFDEKTTRDELTSVQKDLLDAQMLSKRQITNSKLIDRLPEHRQKQAKDLASQIDETNMNAVIAYGSNAQKKLSEFSHSMLNRVQLKDTGEIGDSLTELMTQLQKSNPKDLTAEPNLFKRLFGKVKASISETQIQYQKIGSQIDKVAIRLEREKNELLNDNLMLEQLYEKNKDYFEALNIYIAAGEVKMQELQEKIIPEAIEKAKKSNSQMDVQVVNDLNQFLDRLDKRTHDLRLTRQMTIQQAPQIRMIQNTNQALAEKIQVSVHTAIPLWENQITIALALLRQQNAAVSQRQVSETTNDLLLKNSDMLKQSAIDTARESERGVIDIETLQKTQANLIETLEETLQIQSEGRRQRALAEQELQAMELDLRDKLLQITAEQKQQEANRTKDDNYQF
ncbi:toxic anion resistance protein [Globicatella sp. PHS-GS-PNBC-21-1553]|uniref:toxic anion resistance protein n=1 Tax=Globicatella sp. PHS-GS-PNBC-21-1553 TaxID=2885764 RepID=UPI00298ED8B3|nr:toxic anion resistance protein [Globicatella sp. PHS-GS-PNBC-21-1553]WPC08223.1 toxic anion resistance protein [Globicatella sp. PHS-GS-PNBC-21-1553]